MRETRMKVRLTFVSEVLGTSPSDKEVYSSYISSKSEEGMKNKKQELESLPETDANGDEFEKGVTVFSRDKDGNAALKGYMLKGFFKSACSALRMSDDTISSSLKAFKKKIDLQVFVEPAIATIHMPENAEIEYCERPLRINTAQGDRTALACSESIPEGSYVEFEIVTLSKEMMGYVIEWLDYGKWNGIGAWRNSGKGSFVWQDITDDETRAANEVPIVKVEAASDEKKAGKKAKCEHDYDESGVCKLCGAKKRGRRKAVAVEDVEDTNDDEE